MDKVAISSFLNFNVLNNEELLSLRKEIDRIIEERTKLEARATAITSRPAIVQQPAVITPSVYRQEVVPISTVPTVVSIPQQEYALVSGTSPRVTTPTYVNQVSPVPQYYSSYQPQAQTFYATPRYI